MKSFVMCEACQREYDDPLRSAVPRAAQRLPGVRAALALLDAGGAVIAVTGAALAEAAAAIRAGRIVAVKGLGGFHLRRASR